MTYFGVASRPQGRGGGSVEGHGKGRGGRRRQSRHRVCRCVERGWMGIVTLR